MAPFYSAHPAARWRARVAAVTNASLVPSVAATPRGGDPGDASLAPPAA
jgi:hypothetical protein